MVSCEERILCYIAKGDLQQALETFLSYSQEEDWKTYLKLVLLSYQYQNLLSAKTCNTIAWELETREKSKIAQHLIILLDKCFRSK